MWRRSTVVENQPQEASILVQVEAESLSDLFNDNEINNGGSMKLVMNIGGIKGLAKKLNTDLKNGLADQDAVAQSQKKFGRNDPVERDLTPLYELVLECLQDVMLQILLIAALCSTGIGILNNGLSTGWTEGATIFLAVFLIVSITAGNNYIKERQFRKLQRKLDELKVHVVRAGTHQDIDAKDVVVGDVLQFHIGDILLVDGLMVQGSEVKIDESAMTGESDPQRKYPFEQASTSNSNMTSSLNQKKGNPFLVSGTKVVDGTGIMLVLAVGVNTQQGRLKLLTENESSPTPLQQKLEGLAEDIGKLGTVVALITFLTLIAHLIINWALGDIELIQWSTLQTVIQAFMIGVTIIVVAVPEGLPLAVTIALAYSVNKMKNENNLVKNLASCETMGGANTICSDKTGTLTQNTMTVTSLWIENQIFTSELIVHKKGSITKFSQEILAESIGFNSVPYPKKSSDTGKMIKTGNKTDCALIELIDSWGYGLGNYRPSDRILRVIPFNSNRKRMTTMIANQQNSGIRILVKGASETLLAMCSKLVGPNGIEHVLDSNTRQQIQKNVIEKFAGNALRTIAVAYRDVDHLSSASRSGNMGNLKGIADAIKEEDMEKDLTLIGIAGIKDPVREDVPKAIAQCKRSGILVRMVTGDNMLTAIAIAKEAGILPKDFIMTGNYEVMEGPKFREMVGGLRSEKDEEDKTIYRVSNMEAFQKIGKELKVLARASPEDKYTLVTGLMALGHIVAVTGDGANDAPALRRADVGFAMGISGSDVAKDAADIILTDDKFSSTITACKWGRNIYNCIRKFIQFQLTVNVVALFMSVLGALVLTQSPLNAIQMLWVNLIMDTFASLALATEPPSDDVLDRPPYSRKQPIVSAFMYRTIAGQSVYQIIVLILLLFYLPLILDCTPPPGQAFVLMQVFNSINARKLDFSSLNPFSNLCNNWMFWFIQIITVIIQFALVQFGGVFVSVVPLTPIQHLLCVGVGAFGIIVGIFVKLIPEDVCRKFALFKDREIAEEHMDNTLTSQLRRKSTIRLHTNPNKSKEDPKSMPSGLHPVGE